MSDRQQEGGSVQFPGSVLNTMQRVLADELGPEEAGRLLRAAGADCAPAFETLLADAVSREGAGAYDPGSLESERFWPRLSDFFESLGWGRFEADQLHPGVLALASDNWRESESAKADFPACHFSTGLFAELLRRVAEEDLAVLEVECRAAGDARCRFLVGSETTLEDVYGRIRSGSGYVEAVGGLG